ncbi:MAG: zf-HC2 domain-containing protein [Acidobacteriota bacterium]|nr:MAG: zf-HC2 domain-containing protein [Acidobacteriota bacterium]
MRERCPSGFDVTLVSGYLDHELTQAREQQVRVHLEDCAHCRALLEELTSIREATMSTRFREPLDSQWDERPRGGVSLGARGLGWLLVIVWLIVVSGFGLWHAWVESEGLFERLIIFGGLSGAALLFLSVLLDRIPSARSDRYRGVQK